MRIAGRGSKHKLSRSGAFGSSFDLYWQDTSIMKPAYWTVREKGWNSRSPASWWQASWGTMLPGARVREAGQGEEFIPRDSSRVEMSGEAVTPQAIAGKLCWRKDLHMLRRLWREKQEWKCNGVKGWEGAWWQRDVIFKELFLSFSVFGFFALHVSGENRNGCSDASMT